MPFPAGLTLVVVTCQFDELPADSGLTTAMGAQTAIGTAWAVGIK